MVLGLAEALRVLRTLGMSLVVKYLLTYDCTVRIGVLFGAMVTLVII